MFFNINTQTPEGWREFMRLPDERSAKIVAAGFFLEDHRPLTITDQTGAIKHNPDTIQRLASRWARMQP